MNIELNDPFDVMLLVSPNCKWCKLTEYVLLNVANKNGIPLNIQKIDITKNPEFAERYNILSTPSLILYDKTTIVGALPEEAAREVIERLKFYKK